MIYRVFFYKCSERQFNRWKGFAKNENPRIFTLKCSTFFFCVLLDYNVTYKHCRYYVIYGELSENSLISFSSMFGEIQSVNKYEAIHTCVFQFHFKMLQKNLDSLIFIFRGYFPLKIFLDQ